MVSLGPSGAVDLYLGSDRAAQIVVDVEGYTVGGTPSAAGTFVPVTPKATVRRPHEHPAEPRPAHDFMAPSTWPPHRLSADQVAAVVLNVTVTGATASGYLSAYPAGYRRPGTSNVNFVPGPSTANLVVVPADQVRGVQFYNASAGSLQLVVDIEGYLRAPSLTWSSPASAVNPVHSSLYLIPARRHRSCLATDQRGDVTDVLRLQLGPPESISPNAGMSAIDCLSPTWCVVANGASQILTYDGTGWTTFSDLFSGASTIVSLSCATRTFCVAGDVEGEVAVLTAGGWSAPVPISGGRARVFVFLPCSERVHRGRQPRAGVAIRRGDLVHGSEHRSGPATHVVVVFIGRLLRGRRPPGPGRRPQRWDLARADSGRHGRLVHRGPLPVGQVVLRHRWRPGRDLRRQQLVHQCHHRGADPFDVLSDRDVLRDRRRVRQFRQLRRDDADTTGAGPVEQLIHRRVLRFDDLLRSGRRRGVSLHVRRRQLVGPGAGRDPAGVARWARRDPGPVLHRRRLLRGTGRGL